MYIDPNTGGILFQSLTLCAVCAVPLTALGGALAAVIYFVKKGKKNQPTDTTKDNPA
jgi:hypothetical protein